MTHRKHTWMRALSLMLAAVLVAGLTMAVAPAAEKASAKAINLRLGVLSDVHVGGWNGGLGKSQKQYFQEALKWYQNKGVDAILIAGDLTQGFCSDAEAEKQFADFADAWFSVFPDNKNTVTNEHVEPIFLYGNHDYQLQDSEKTKHLWKKYMKEDYQPVYRKEVKGYQFVCASWGHEWEIAGPIDDAVRAAKGKPVFYAQHPHPANTCYGGETWGDSNAAASVLKNHENVISFSGHSHFPLTDERSIWQDGFTSVGTATLHYTELEPGKAGGTVPKDAYKVKQGSYVTVTDDQVVIERHNFFYDEKIGQDWVLDLPLKKENFKYRTDTRTAAAVAPEFSAGAKVTLEGIGKNWANVRFPAAVLNSKTDLIQSYVLEAFNNNTGKVDATEAIFSEFYLGLGRLGTEYQMTVDNLKPDTDYTFKVYALESFQKRSKPITLKVKTGKDKSGDVDILSPDVLDVTFQDGTAKDQSISETPSEVMGGAKIEFDPEIGKNVLKLNGNGQYVNYRLNKDQYSSMKKQMTMELIFKGNALNSNQALAGCTQNGGVGFEITGKGEVDLWFTVGGSYFTSSGKRPTVKMNDNQYHHIMFTYTGKQLVLYFDGQKVASYSLRKMINFNTEVNFALGADAQPGGEGQLFLNGNIALARLYSHGFDADQVKTAYANAMSTKTLLSLYNVSNGELKVYSDEACKNEITDLTGIEKNQTVYVKALPAEGYQVKTLTVDGVDYENGSPIVVNGQKAVRVLFAKEGEESSSETSSEAPVEPSKPEASEQVSDDTTEPSSEAQPSNPDSGIMSPIAALAGLGVAAAGTAAVLIHRRKKQNIEEEDDEA